MANKIKVSWKPDGLGGADAFVGERKVASIKKFGNHNNDGNDVYASTVLDRKFRTHQYIKNAKEEINEELAKLFND